MSIGFMLENKDDSVVWRGPKKTGECDPVFGSTYFRDCIFTDFRVIVATTTP
jgi:hypothetical protein